MGRAIALPDALASRGPYAAAIVGLGVLTGVVHLFHALTEPGIHAIALGVVLPLWLSATLVAAGAWLLQSDLDPEPVRRVAVWTGVGLLIGIGFGYPVIPYQTAHGVSMTDVPFLLVNWATTGALGGFSIGYYDGMQQQYRAELEAERAEIAARERELTRQNERLDRFASVISHDLRNPINVASGHLELLAEETENRHVDAARTAVERMDTLVEDVLTLTRQGQPIDETEPVSLADVAERSWSVVEAPGATLSIGEELTVIADETRLQQLLENLFRNAVEHGSTASRTPGASGGAVANGSTDAEGAGLTITVGALPDGSGFSVADDGVGIPEDERGNLFEAGYSTTESGTGLGLAIVRDIADAHGWEIALTEGDEGGARFEIRDVATPSA